MSGRPNIRTLHAILGYGLLPLALLCLIVITLSLSARAEVAQEPSGGYVITPQYEKTLQRVLLTLETTTEDLSNHRSIITSLPDYTEVIMLTPEQLTGEVRRELDAMGVTRHVTVVPFETRRMDMKDAYILSTNEQRIKPFTEKVPIPRGTVWAQDLFKVATASDGSSIVLTPFIHKFFIHKDDIWGGKLFTDNQFISKLETEGIHIRNLSEVFKGGNVLVDKHRGVRLAFVGGDVIRETIMVMAKAMDRSVTADEVIEQLRQDLGVERVVVIGMNDHQPLKMFHLDQAMVLLGGGVAAVTHVIDGKRGITGHDLDDVLKFLTELRATLTGLGYTIVDMDATVSDVMDYRYYVNGIAYINKKTKHREFLFPMFETSLSGSGHDIFLRNISTLEKQGYQVVPVFTDANRHHGGLHCMVNVIS